MSASLLATIALGLTVALAVIWDVRQRRIPNWITYPALSVGLLLGALDGRSGIVDAALGIAVALAIFIVPVALLGIGAGDLKLAMALGSLGGPLYALWFCLYAMAAGGMVALVALLRNRVSAGATPTDGAVPAGARRLTIPYAVPIALGALAALVDPGMPR